MRTAPALQVTVDRFGIWHAALGLLIAASVAVIGAWLAAGEDRHAAVAAGVLAASAIAVAAAASRYSIQPFVLRWDGVLWHLSAANSADGAAWSGRIAIALDLGSWLLLSFTPDTGPRRCRHRWLPLQRRGLEAQWHALRATVYCARFAGPGRATAVRRDPAE